MATLVVFVTVIVLAGCGNSQTGSKASAPETTRTPLTQDDIPDVLTPGIWPEQSSTAITASREGDAVTVETGWEAYDPAHSVALCNNVINDLQEPGLTVQVYGGAANDILLAWNLGSGRCHDLGNHT